MATQAIEHTHEWVDVRTIVDVSEGRFSYACRRCPALWTPEHAAAFVARRLDVPPGLVLSEAEARALWGDR